MASMTLYKGRYRVDSMRLSGRDYAQPGSYFVTVVTKHCISWFGEIRHGIMGLNDRGCIVADELQRTSIIRPNVSVKPWVVMPDHWHAIITIGTVETDGIETQRRCVSAAVAQCIPLFRRRPNELGSIVQQIKYMCTKRIHAMGYHEFSWQSGYHDHIIRSRRSMRAIRAYIQQNPLKWHNDHIG